MVDDSFVPSDHRTSVLYSIDGFFFLQTVRTILETKYQFQFNALGHIILPCQVKNKRGMLQWTRDGFGLGVERNLTGFDRYHMSGYDEEGKEITHTVIF